MQFMQSCCNKWPSRRRPIKSERRLITFSNSKHNYKKISQLCNWHHHINTYFNNNNSKHDSIHLMTKNNQQKVAINRLLTISLNYYLSYLGVCVRDLVNYYQFL